MDALFRLEYLCSFICCSIYYYILFLLLFDAIFGDNLAISWSEILMKYFMLVLFQRQQVTHALIHIHELLCCLHCSGFFFMIYFRYSKIHTSSYTVQCKSNKE